MIGTPGGGSRVLGLLLILAFFAGCAQNEAVKADLDSEYTKWKDLSKTNEAVSPARKVEPSPAAPEPGVQEKTGASQVQPRPLPTQPVSLRMHSASVPSVLRALARAANQNIMISEGVAGNISIDVNATAWDKVFKGILATQGLTWVWQDDILRVVSVKDKENELKQLETDLKMQATRRDLKTLEPLVTRVIPLHYYNFSKRQIVGTGGTENKGRSIMEQKDEAAYMNFKSNLENLLSLDKDGKPIGDILIDEHTNSIVIHGLVADAEKVIALIKELDSAPPQIIIEAYIVETTRETARELGIQWGGLYHAGNYWITPGANTSGVFDKTLSEGVDPTTGIAGNFPADLGTQDNPSGLTLGYLYQKLGDYVLDVELSALQTQGKLNILSRPSITTMDNQPAVIESGAEVPYQTVVGTGGTQDVSIEFKNASLRLEVTPRVVEGRMVRMNVLTTKDELDFTRTVLGNPTIITKRAETNLILESGETTVIGGLTKETSQLADDGVPGLMDVPGLKYLFGREGTSTKMEDVLIFITPRILLPRAERTAAAGGVPRAALPPGGGKGK